MRCFVSFVFVVVFFCQFMYSNERYSSFRKEEFDDKQHLSDIDLQKLRSVTKTKIAGELTIKSANLGRTLYLAGQNMTKNTVEKIRNILEETYHTDEYFLDEIESILAPYWEELADEEIARILIESFEVFDPEKQGFITKEDLIENLTRLGEMPLNREDFQIIFSMIEKSKTFDYHRFVQKLCSSTSQKKKRKKKNKMKVKRTIK